MKRRYNQTLDLSPGVQHARRGVIRFFDGYVMAPRADHNFAEAQMIRQALGCVVVFGWLMAGASVQAHHSTAGIYDPAKEGGSPARWPNSSS